MEKTALLEDAKLKDNFQVFCGLLVVLLISIMARDIDRPFTGLHSWGEAHRAWLARNHIKYGLTYTKGLNTWAVGNPPAKDPVHYLDHPQLRFLLHSGSMLIFGVNEQSLRMTGIIMAVVSLLLLLKLVRALTDEKTAILAALFFILFPLTGYFGVGEWRFPLALWTFWCYLVLIGSIKNGPKPSLFHKCSLAVSLFLIIQLGWEGFFPALAIGVHYVSGCVYRRKWPQPSLLTILVLAPLLSLLLNFAVMAAGRGWDIQRIFTLYKWRAGKGEMEVFLWSKWFAKLWEFAVMNFSLPVLILSIGYLTAGQLKILVERFSKKKDVEIKWRFPQFWLFILTGIFQLFLLKGTLWMHHYWERPFAPLIAISAALAIMMLADILAKIRSYLPKIIVPMCILVVTFFCAKGLNYYHSIRHFSPARVELFSNLNKVIPADKALLSFEDFIVNQNKAKGAHYRPEVAWYLDREVVTARTVEEIEKQAGTGRFLFYLMPEQVYDSRADTYLANLSKQLQQRYKFISIARDPGAPGKAPMFPYLLFDLRSKAQGYLLAVILVFL